MLREKIVAAALNVLEIEQQAIHKLQDKINDNFIHACEYLLNCEGRVVVMGIGKSGHVASKFAATLASTGTPAFFMHPSDASHGDLGMLTTKDIAVAISYSGESNEILTLIPAIKRLGVPLISFTGNMNSQLAKNSTIVINVAVEKEACPFDLAPTASTTAALVMSDAVAISLLQARDFTAEDFARSHPGGRLGKRLSLVVEDLMHVGKALPKVSQDVLLSDALIEITEKKLGMTTVVDAKNQLVGIFTDGDLRRAMQKNIDIHHTFISAVMSKNPRTISKEILAMDALKYMEQYKITALIIANVQKEPIGVIHLHDILQSGIA